MVAVQETEVSSLMTRSPLPLQSLFTVSIKVIQDLS